MQLRSSSAHYAIDTTGSVILADEGVVATLGVRDLIIVIHVRILDLTEEEQNLGG